jgi:hypothetical protein
MARLIHVSNSTPVNTRFGKDIAPGHWFTMKNCWPVMLRTTTGYIRLFDKSTGRSDLACNFHIDDDGALESLEVEHDFGPQTFRIDP